MINMLRMIITHRGQIDCPYPQNWLKGGDSVSNIEMRHVPVPGDDNIFLYTGQ